MNGYPTRPRPLWTALVRGAFFLAPISIFSTMVMGRPPTWSTGMLFGLLFLFVWWNAPALPDRRYLMTFLLPYFLVMTALLSGSVGLGRSPLIALYVGFLYLTSATIVVVAGWLAHRQMHGRPFMVTDDTCAYCGYNLTGNTTGRCPECGRERLTIDQSM